jgi:hypothetical protein
VAAICPGRRSLATNRRGTLSNKNMISMKGGFDMTVGEVELHSMRRIGPVQSEPTVSVVIPAKNEARNLPHVFAGLASDLQLHR